MIESPILRDIVLEAVWMPTLELVEISAEPLRSDDGNLLRSDEGNILYD